MADFIATLVDLAKSPDKVKEETAQYAAVPSPAYKPSTPAYPYGLTICLDSDTLDKLGLSGDLPDVGDKVTIIAVGTVTSASANQDEQADGTMKVRRRVELELRQIGVKSVDDIDRAEEMSAERQTKWYGGADKAAAA